jgi:dihydrodipicolinate synthase/N-acetylneuraminate lyase
MESEYPSPPKGLICPVITPLKKDKTLDTASLERLLDHACPASDGILVCDVIWGESLLLPDDTRLDMVLSTLEMLKGRIPLWVTITGQTLKKTRHFMTAAASFADRMDYPGMVFWMDYPLFYHSNRGLPQMYQNLLSGTQRSLILGNLPHLIKMEKGPGRRYNIRTNILQKVVQHPGIKGMVFFGTLKRSLNYQQTLRFRKDFTFYDGDEAVFLKNPGTGGLVAGGSNLIPDTWLKITRSSLNRYDTERQFHSHQAEIWESGLLIHALHSLYQEAPAFYMKKILTKVGIIADDYSLLSGIQQNSKWQERLDQFLNQYDLI